MTETARALTRVSRAGRHTQALKTYVPATIARILGVQNGDVLVWEARAGKVTVRVAGKT